MKIRKISSITGRLDNDSTDVRLEKFKTLLENMSVWSMFESWNGHKQEIDKLMDRKVEGSLSPLEEAEIADEVQFLRKSMDMIQNKVEEWKNSHSSNESLGNQI